MKSSDLGPAEIGARWIVRIGQHHDPGALRYALKDRIYISCEILIGRTDRDRVIGIGVVWNFRISVSRVNQFVTR